MHVIEIEIDCTSYTIYGMLSVAAEAEQQNEYENDIFFDISIYLR